VAIHPETRPVKIYAGSVRSDGLDDVGWNERRGTDSLHSTALDKSPSGDILAPDAEKAAPG
jgi:hypothetical protein